MGVHGSFPWLVVLLGSAFISALALGAVRRVRDFFRNLWRDWVYQRGTVGVDGISETVKPARVRMKEVEYEVRNNLVTKTDHKVLVTKVEALDRGQVEILRRLDENKKTTEQIDKKVSRNGEDSPALGDTAARSEKMLSAIAEKLGVDFEPELRENLRRRSDDRESTTDDPDGDTL